MGLSDRIEGTIERWAARWSNRLAGWMVGWAAGGVNRFLELNEPEAIDLVRQQLQTVRDDPDTPEDIRQVIDKLTAGTQPIPVVILIALGVILMIPTITSISRPLGNILTYKQEAFFKSGRLDMATIIDLVRRNPETYRQFWEDMRDLGFSDERLAAVQELVKAVPPLADMVRFADFAAFDPEVIEAFREFYDAPENIAQAFRLVGIDNEGDRDWANKYWFSHFRQPGRFELGEIYRRGLLGEPLVGSGDYGGEMQVGEAERAIKLAYQSQGLSEYWQGRLLQLVREIPTRVDVRRWWDMRTINEAELRDIYRRQGYFGKDLDNYVLWTKVYTDFPSLMARWQKGWLTIDQVRQRLTDLGMPAERVEEMLQEKIAPEQPERVEEGRNLTKSEIYKGVKKGVIDQEQGIELLMDLGHSRAEAEYLMVINVEALTGSPESFEEFKSLTQKWRAAVGREAKPVPEELRQLGRQVIEQEDQVGALQGSLQQLEDSIIDEDALQPEQREDLDEKRRELLRARAELERLQTDYRIKLAEYRQEV